MAPTESQTAGNPASEAGADFRSDTLTKPTTAMREAMASAVVGDDVFDEDPTITALQEDAAAFLGKEAALYVPSGTMANQLAIHVWCRPGDEIICEQRAHVFLYECGSAARLSGVQLRMIDGGDAGFPEPEAVRAAVRSTDLHHPRSRMLWLENSHNMAGGRVLGADGMAALVAVGHEHGMKVHIDGARLANAAIAAGVTAAQLAAEVDSVSLCLSKGMGAPVGSVLAGSREFVERARFARKAFGGGMRQAGVIAAAGRMALNEAVVTLTKDHERAQTLAQGLAKVPDLRIEPSLVQTNILMVELLKGTAADFVQRLDAAAVRALPVGPKRVRFVTHRDISDAGVARCLKAASQLSAATN